MSQKKGLNLNSKNSKKKKLENSSKKNSTLKSNCQTQKYPKKTDKPRPRIKITPEREPLVYECKARGLGCPETAKEFEKEFSVKLDQSTINIHLHKHQKEYKQYLEELKDVRLANAKARIFDLEYMAGRLGESILDIIKTVPKKQWDAVHLAGLIKEYRELLAQIQDESGDKVHKIKGEGLNGSNIVFGDQIVNAYADKIVEERRKDSPDSGDRFKKAGLSDFGNSISSN